MRSVGRIAVCALALLVIALQVLLMRPHSPSPDARNESPSQRPSSCYDDVLRQALGRVDADGDGAVTRSEWLMVGDARDFDRLDLDRDGRIDAGELGDGLLSEAPASMERNPQRWWSSEAFAPPTSAEKSTSPIVIVLALDTLRADHLGCYGYGRPTSPWLDRLASEGVLFENAYSQSNWSLPSYAALLTGRYSANLDEKTWRLQRSQSTLPSLVQAYGVKTAAFVAGGHLNHEFGWGRDFHVYRDAPDFGSLFHTLPSALAWLGSCATDRSPSFVFIHGYDMHAPYRKPLFFENLYDRGYDGPGRFLVTADTAFHYVAGLRYFRAAHRQLQAQGETGGDGASSVALVPRDVAHILAAYDGAVSYADVFVGLLMCRIRQLGIENRTLLVVLGDHGEQLLEEGRMGHGYTLKERELHVPLILWGRGVPAGVRVARLVELLDVMPTVLTWLHVPPPADLDGTSLLPPPGAAEGAAVAVSRNEVTLRVGRWRLVLSTGRGRDGLFDVKADPDQHENRIDDPRLRETVAAMRARLWRRLGPTVRSAVAAQRAEQADGEASKARRRQMLDSATSTIDGLRETPGRKATVLAEACRAMLDSGVEDVFERLGALEQLADQITAMDAVAYRAQRKRLAERALNLLGE